MQHQELLVYDIKHLLCDQYDAPMKPAPASSVKVEGMAEIEGDCSGWVTRLRSEGQCPKRASRPLHTSSLLITRSLRTRFSCRTSRSIARSVSNGDFLEFIRDGGYQNFRWWFSEGWETVNREHWRAPLYWELHDGEWMIRDFAGLHRPRAKRTSPFLTSAFSKLGVCEVGGQASADRSRMGKGGLPLTRDQRSEKRFPGATSHRRIATGKSV